MHELSLAVMLSVWAIKELVWVMRFQSPLVYINSRWRRLSPPPPPSPTPTTSTYPTFNCSTHLSNDCITLLHIEAQVSCGGALSSFMTCPRARAWNAWLVFAEKRLARDSFPLKIIAWYFPQMTDVCRSRLRITIPLFWQLSYQRMTDTLRISIILLT